MKTSDLENIIMYGHKTNISIPAENAMRVFSENLSKAQVFQMLSFYAEIEDSEINVPKVNKVFPVGNDKWGILEDNIRGRTMFEEMNDDPENYDEFIDILIDLQISINEIYIDGIIPIKSKLRFQINSLKIISDEKKNELLKTLEQLPDGKNLLHGNFGPEVIITDNRDMLYVTEWASASCGDFSADAAMTYLKLSCNSTEAAERYLKMFKEKTKADSENLRKWIPIMAASQIASGTVSVLQREFMYAWLDIKSDKIFDDLLKL